MEGIEIKSISPEETYDLRHRVMWPDHPREFIKLPEDGIGIHFGLFVSNKLISVISLFISNEDAQFRKFATADSEQGKGYGSQLLRHIIEYSLTNGIQRLWCNARVDKTLFYKNFGFKETKVMYNKGGIDFIILERKFH